MSYCVKASYRHACSPVFVIEYYQILRNITQYYNRVYNIAEYVSILHNANITQYAIESKCL